jgi:hypothetical protein
MNGTRDELDSRCYRPRPYYLVLGTTCALFFLTAAILSPIAMMMGEAPFSTRAAAAVFMALFWSCWFLLSLAIVAANFRERLFINDLHVHQVNLLTTRNIALDDVTSVTWCIVPKVGSVVLRSPATNINVYFDNFTASERQELMRYFLEAFPPEIQKDWPKFEERLLKPPSAQNIIRARRANRVFIVAHLACAVFFASLWATGRGDKFLVLAFLNAGLGVFLSFLLRLRRQPAKAPFHA